MFHDDIQALTAKKYEILGELELAKAAIMREMSTVDKCSLTRLREILAHYDRLEKSVIDKLNTFDVKVAAFISNAEKDYSVFADEIKALDTIKKNIGEIKQNVATVAAAQNNTNNRTYEFRRNENTSDAINAILKIASSYYKHNDEFVYGNWHTALNTDCVTVGGKWELDCSSFVQLVAMGVPFENSRYNGNTKNTPTAGHVFPDMIITPAADRPHGMLASHLAEWCYNHGYLYEIERDFSRVRPGDIIFMGVSDNPNAWRSIQHCEIAVGVVHCYDNLRCIGIGDDRGIKCSMYKPGHCRFGARLPFPCASPVRKNIVSEDNVFGEITMEILANKYGGRLARLNVDEALEGGEVYTINITLNKPAPDNVYYAIGTSVDNVYKELSKFGQGGTCHLNNTFFVPNNVTGLVSSGQKLVDVRIGLMSEFDVDHTFTLDIANIEIIKGYANWRCV